MIPTTAEIVISLSPEDLDDMTFDTTYTRSEIQALSEKGMGRAPLSEQPDQDHRQSTRITRRRYLMREYAAMAISLLVALPASWRRRDRLALLLLHSPSSPAGWYARTPERNANAPCIGNLKPCEASSGSRQQAISAPTTRLGRLTSALSAYLRLLMGGP